MLRKRPDLVPLIMVLLALLTMGCKGDPKKEAETIAKDSAERELSEAEKLIHTAINHAGGMDSWNAKKTMSYIKTIQSYDSTGTLIRTQAQVHKYQLHPSFKANMKWEQNGRIHEIINSGKQAWKLIDGEIQKDKASVDNAWNSSFGSHYMVGMPFKLRDPGTSIEYKGIDTLSNKKIVHKLEVTYEKGAGSSGGMHTWHYFLDTEDYKIVANFLDHGKGYSYTDYDTFAEVEGILVTKERKSYASNKQGEALYLKNSYGNSEIQFDIDLPQDLFIVED